jgi:hypothetical protein
LESIENTYLKERFSILNAFYLPGNQTYKPYRDITPVNTFRLILNNYFNQQLPIIEDKNYYSTWENPFQFVDITEDIEKVNLKEFISQAP